MSLSALDIVVVTLYVVLVLSVTQIVSLNGSSDLEGGPHRRTSSRTQWWAIGASLIATNISAEQIIGMSGSAYVLGLAVASYEWLGAAALLIVGKYILPIYLNNHIYSMPEFLRRRYGKDLQVLMAACWIGVYVFVVLTSILWLGATAVHTVTGLSLVMSLVLLGLFAGNYALYAGLKSSAYADLIQVSMLILGGLVIAWFSLTQLSGHTGVPGLLKGFHILSVRLPDHFHLILGPESPYYKYVPGVSAIVGGMWIVNMSYWGFNQNIIQRALKAETVRDAQNGVVFAAILKLLVPILVVLPGIAAVALTPHLSRPDEAYPTLMTRLPNGLLGFVFVVLVAAIISSMRSTLNSISTIFTVDVVDVVAERASRRQNVIIERFSAIVALAIAMIATVPLLRSFDQAFQFIQEYSGFFTPGVTAVFLLGIFWKQTTEAGALVAALCAPITSVLLKTLLPHVPFMNRIGFVFLVATALGVAVSAILRSQRLESMIDFSGIDYSTSKSFNIVGSLVVAILILLYINWW